MGIPIEPIPPGNDCLACFDAGETPSYIYIMFEGVKKGNPPNSFEPPNGREFKCDQDDINACLFWYNQLGTGWKVRFERNVGSGRWHIGLYYNAFEHFLGSNPGCPSEHDIYDNIFLNPAIRHGYDGVASIFWLETAAGLVDAIGLAGEPGTFLEFFLIDELNPVYKLCNTHFHLNQTFRMAP